MDVNENPVTLQDSEPVSEPSNSLSESQYYSFTAPGPLSTSMVSHWNPLPVKISRISDSITMVTHTVTTSSPTLSLCSAQEFREMFDKMCERLFAKLEWDKLETKLTD